MRSCKNKERQICILRSKNKEFKKGFCKGRSRSILNQTEKKLNVIVQKYQIKDILVQYLSEEMLNVL